MSGIRGGGIRPAAGGSGGCPLLELREIRVPGRDRPRLDGVSLTLHPGERVALLGASGAGKSSLLAVANGLLPPEAGTVRWQGEAPARGSRRRRLQQARIGTLWQELRLIEELTVQQNLNAARLARWGWIRALLNLLLPLESEACCAALRTVDLEVTLLDQPVAALSGGQRQRVAIARLLRQEPDLLLADEPLASLDPRLASELLALLLHQGEAPRGLLLSLHRPDLLAGFDRVIGLQEGRLLFDLPLDQLQPEQLRELYGGPGAAAAAGPLWAPSEGTAPPPSGGEPRPAGTAEAVPHAIPPAIPDRLSDAAIDSGAWEVGVALAQAMARLADPSPAARQALVRQQLGAEHPLVAPLQHLLADPGLDRWRVRMGGQAMTARGMQARAVEAQAMTARGGLEAHSLEVPAMEGPTRHADAMSVPALDASAMDASAMKIPALNAPAMDGCAGDGSALNAPALNVPAVDAPAIETGAMELPAMDGSALDSCAMNAPAVDVPAVDVPAIETGVMELPALDGCAMNAPAIETGAMELPAMNAAATASAALRRELATWIHPRLLEALVRVLEGYLAARDGDAAGSPQLAGPQPGGRPPAPEGRG